MSQSFHVGLALVPLAGALFACGPAAQPTVVRAVPKPAVTADAAPDPAARAARIKRIRGWEPPAMKKFHVEFPDGLMSTDVEAMAPPKVECEQGKGDTRTCNMVVELGKDSEGSPRTFECSASWAPFPLPFGVMLQSALGKFSLEELPRFTTSWGTGSEGGLMATFYAPAVQETDAEYVVGSAKYAVRYTPGHTILCGDISGGAEKTFARLSAQVLESTKVKGMGAGVLVQSAFRSRRGDDPVGFRYVYLRTADDGGYTEVGTEFRLNTGDDHWDVDDAIHNVTRDAQGNIVSMREAAWSGADVSVVLSAKPSESGRLRIKVERGEKSDALELTPRAPLSTEMWEAQSLLRVGAGTRPNHRYAHLSLDPDGEPTLSYSALTRLRDGVLEERIEPHGAKIKGASDDRAAELTLDPQGLVSKQVSPDSVDDRLFAAGKVPNVGPVPPPPPSQKPSAKAPPKRK